MANNPIRYNDPSGHTTVCVLGGSNGCQKWAGLTGVNAAHGFEKVNNDKQANALIVLRKYLQKKNAGTTYSWVGLTPVEQDIMSAGDWTPNAFSESLNGSASPADFWHDPATYVVATVGLGGIFNAGVVGVMTGGTAYGSSSWAAPWEGRVMQNGITYSIHALERMMPVGLGGRGIPPSVVQNAIEYGDRSYGDFPNVVKIVYANVTVIYNTLTNTVITVIKTGH
jgi:hypothetical protein